MPYFGTEFQFLNLSTLKFMPTPISFENKHDMKNFGRKKI